MTECEQDIVTSLVRESLASAGEEVGVRVTRLGEEGVIRGHLVSLKSGACIYQGLEREGIIAIK